MFWILGATGQVGRALIGGAQDSVIALDRVEFNFTKPDSLEANLEQTGSPPKYLINAAAYTQVDRAESEKEIAFRVNAEAPAVLAGWCAKHNVKYVHFSTDYVFSGDGSRPWTETDKPAPKNVYGLSKLAGEEAIQKAGGDYLILRTSWIYSCFGANFLKTMLDLGKKQETLRVVSDQIGAPTYAPHIARAVYAMVKRPKPSGIYNLCAAGETSWNGFAEEIFAQARTIGGEIGVPLIVEKVEPITTAQYPTPAARPLNSRLDMTKTQATFGVTLPDWKAGVAECLAQISQKQG
jgi:dTDP-4-dehydrorhamnose reductase